MKGALGAAFAAAALVTLSGCAEFERLELSTDSDPPLKAVVSYEKISIVEGLAVLIVARPLDTSGDLMDEDTVVKLTPKDPAVLGIAFTLPSSFNENIDEPPWSFVLFGVAEGSTSITVRINNEDKAEIPAVVEPQ